MKTTLAVILNGMTFTKDKLLELVSKLNPAKHKIWSSIKEGLKEVELMDLGKMKAKSAKEFLDEL